MAKKRGVPGWHSMRKDQLVRALVKAGKKPSSQASRRSPRGKSTAANHRKSSNSNGKQTSPRAQRRIRQLQSKLEQIKNLAASTEERRNGKPIGDRLIVMVRDPYWLHAYWELSRQSVERAQAAMGQHWHAAKPTLRLYKVADDGSATWLRSITIHGGVSNWYVDVHDPPCSFRLEIGYEAGEDMFFCLARSNTVSTPPAGMSDAVDENWKDVAQNADRIFAMSGGYSPQGTSQELQELLEERLQRPMGSPMHTRFGAGADRNLSDASDFQLAVDAELIVYGVSRRDAHITLKGEPVRLRSDGSFSVRLSMPDRRQVIPVVASTCDGVEQRTIVLAVERNTKVMEPVVRDSTA
jgi:hypothetical protein